MKLLDCPLIKLDTRGGCYYWTYSTKVNAVVCGKFHKLKLCPCKEERHAKDSNSG